MLIQRQGESTAQIARKRIKNRMNEDCCDVLIYTSNIKLTKLKGLGVRNQIVNDSDSKPSEFDRRLRYESNSND